MSAIIYLPLVLLVFFYAVFYYFTRPLNYWKKRNVPGPEPQPFFGNLKDTALRRKNIGVVIQEVYDMFPKEKVVGMYRMTTPCLLIRDLEIVKHIMIKDFDFFADRGIEFSKKGLGANLFHADGETWQALRGKFSPIFTSGKLKNMYPLMSARAKFFMDYVKRETQMNIEQDIHPLIQKYTISTIAACAFGIDMASFDDGIAKPLEKIDKLALTANFSLEIDMLFPGILKKTGLSLFPSFVPKFFNTLVKDITTARRGKPMERHDFMDLILELRRLGEVSNTKYKIGGAQTLDITDDIIAGQAFVFFLGGYETSATTLSYAFYHLALNPDIQNKLIAEIDEIIQEHNGEITYESLQQMKYMHKVMDETLRMYSIVEPLQRKATADYKIPGTDVVIKKDQLVLISPRAIHYDETYYPNPRVFDPERFDPKVVGERHPCAYLPFGLGQRNCIGMRFGKLQSQLCVASLLSKYRLEPSKNTNMNLDVNPGRIIIGPKGPIQLNFVSRT